MLGAVVGDIIGNLIFWIESILYPFHYISTGVSLRGLPNKNML